MASQKYNPASDIHYLADTIEDLKSLPKHSMGDTCLVIENQRVYMANSEGEWIDQEAVKAGVDLKGYVTTEQLADYVTADKLADYATADQLKEYALIDKVAEYMPTKYSIRNCPVETSIDYRDKEIRIYCHEDAQFVKQQVGEGGNPNMYYMTFRSYAPTGAVYLKEGDKGVVLDEIINLNNGTGCGVDQYGRAYKDHWFALAMYDETNAIWKYFGETSNVSKYIGWSYVAEWYDENNKLINTDAVRINLSNKNCHNLLAHYYG